MYCPNDGKKMKLWEINDRYTASNCYKCLKCDLIIRYRSSPQRFEIIEVCPGCYHPECPNYLGDKSKILQGRR